MNTTRRAFLKKTGGAAAGVAGLTAASGTAAAFWMGQPVFTTDNLNVRDAPCGTAFSVAEQYTGGRVIDGPVDCGGYRRWGLDYNGDSNSGPVTGWSAEDWLYPADFGYPTYGYITQEPQSGHMAADISAAPGNDDVGTPIRAARGGTVVYTERSSTGYGNHVIIDHGYGYTTLYAHLHDFYVATNDTVGFGEQIGEMGDTGNSSAAHLHFEIRKDGYKQHWPVQYSDDIVDLAGVAKNFSGIPSL